MNARIMREILLACPFCQQSGFTHAGLRAHVCKRKPGPTRRGAPLTKAEYLAVKRRAK